MWAAKQEDVNVSNRKKIKIILISLSSGLFLKDARGCVRLVSACGRSDLRQIPKQTPPRQEVYEEVFVVLFLPEIRRTSILEVKLRFFRCSWKTAADVFFPCLTSADLDQAWSLKEKNLVFLLIMFLINQWIGSSRRSLTCDRCDAWQLVFFIFTPRYRVQLLSECESPPTGADFIPRSSHLQVTATWTRSVAWQTRGDATPSTSFVFVRGRVVFFLGIHRPSVEHQRLRLGDNWNGETWGERQVWKRGGSDS